MLSGFLIGGILLDTRSEPSFFKIFWIRRFARIFPVAYLMLATYAVAIWVTDHFGITRFNNWLLAEYRPPLWTFATFTQSLPIAMHGYGGPKWMAMTWSLAIEEQFYLLFPLAVYFLPRKWLIAVVATGIIASPILRDILERIFGSWYSAYVLLPSRMDGLMYGVAVALIVRSEKVFNIAQRYRLLMDAVAVLIFYSIVTNWTFSLWPGPSGAMFPLKQSFLAIMWAIIILRIFTCNKSIFNKIWCNRTLAKVGLISYGLYMYHQMVNGLVHSLLFDSEPVISNISSALASLAVVTISVALAIISYRWFESPIRRLAAAKIARSSAKAIRVQGQNYSVSALGSSVDASLGS